MLIDKKLFKYRCESLINCNSLVLIVFIKKNWEKMFLYCINVMNVLCKIIILIWLKWILFGIKDIWGIKGYMEEDNRNRDEGSRIW